MMNLDDLEEQVKVKLLEEEEKDKSAKSEESDDDDEYESSVEEDLSTALSLLEDCYQVFEDILKTKNQRKISTYLYTRAEDLGMEIMAFIAQWDTEKDKDKPLNIDWKGEL